MGNDLTVRSPNENTAIRSSPAALLRQAIPAWVDTSWLDTDVFHMQVMPKGQDVVLAAAAEAHRLALAPASHDERDKILMGLRSATILRREDVDEADASFKLLTAHLFDVPRDILQEACRRYVNEPGPRYFPRSAGELRTFTNPLMVARSRRAYRLKLMARTAAEQDAERARLAKGQALDPSEVGEANRLMKRLRLNTRYQPDGTAFQLGETDDADPVATPAPEGLPAANSPVI